MSAPKKTLADIGQLAGRFARIVAEDESGHFTWHQAVHRLGNELHGELQNFFKETDPQDTSKDLSR